MNLEKYILLLHGRSRLEVSIFTNCLNSWHLEFLKKLLDRLDTKGVKKSDFLSILYSKSLREYEKPKSKVGDKIRFSKFEWLFREGSKPQLTQEVYESVRFSSKKPPTYTMKDEQYEIIRGKIYQKELIEDIQQWNHLQKCWSPMHLHSCFQIIKSALIQIFTGATEVGRSLGSCNFGKMLPINVLKCHGKKIMFFD